MPNPTILDNAQDLKPTESSVTEPTKTEPTQDDLIKRASSFTEKPSEPKPNEVDFNMAEFDQTIGTIEDENLKNAMLSLKKSLVSGANNKYQEIATLRKDLESKKLETSNTPGRPAWTPESIKEALKDPNFVNSANQVMSQASSEEFLTDEEKAQRARLQTIEEQNKTLILQQQQLVQKQQDESLRGKYTNYDSNAVDTISAELIQGKVQNTREYIWKAKDYEDAVNRAYKMGRTDERTGIQENVNSASFEGTETISSAPVKKEQGESNGAFLKRLYLHNMSKK